MKLIIAEKPSVARDIAAVLGKFTKHPGALYSDNYVISWCIGHLAEFAPPEAYNPTWKKWRADDLPMLPDSFRLVPSKRTLDHWKLLKGYLADSQFTSVINACDAGREGELIFRQAYELAGSTLPIERLWLSSMTAQAIEAAFNALKPGEDYDNLHAAARSRSEADWLVGLNATRAMTLAAAKIDSRGGVKSLGRVQTPTLALLVERELAIRNHVPSPFFNLYATFRQGDANLEAELVTTEPKNRLLQKDQATKLLSDIKALSDAVITKVEAKEKLTAPPLPYDLSTLQREANLRHNLTAQQTLDAAQNLYEQKLLTYPRTDSRHLTQDMAATLMRRIEAASLDPWSSPSLQDDSLPLSSDIQELANTIVKNPGSYAPEATIFNDSEVTDHHAILPTETALSHAAASNLGPAEIAIYELVQRRFLAQFLGAAQHSLAHVEVQAGDHRFEAKGTRLDRLGWQQIDPPNSQKGDKLLPSVAPGNALLAGARLHEGQTKPPNRHTEASLLAAMERAGADLDEGELRKIMKGSGLGTAATRASIIETLLRREYAQRNGKTIVATEVGEQLIASLPDTGLKSPALTARWEAALGRIERGELPRSEFMAKVRKLTAAVVTSIESATLHFDAPEAIGECPLCKTGVQDIGKVYTCQTGRDCTFIIGKRIAKKTITETHVKALLAGETVGPLKGFKSKKGKDFSASLKLNAEGGVDFVFDSAKA